MAHTPGTWTVLNVWRREDPAGMLVGTGPTEYPVCAMTGYYGPEQTAANARLIAAAPDLLVACKGIDQLMLVVESAVRNSDPGNHAAIIALLKAARAAIAKATGEAG